ncbi:hypothetical protein EBT31_07480 [bacterium]|nr:hypothetical protein [bacterium]
MSAVCEEMLTLYGITNIPEHMGFLLPNGLALDFGGGCSRGRGIDHRNICGFATPDEEVEHDRTATMYNIMRARSLVRVHFTPEYCLVCMQIAPTQLQVESISRATRRLCLELDVFRGNECATIPTRSCHQLLDTWGSLPKGRNR